MKLHRANSLITAAFVTAITLSLITVSAILSVPKSPLSPLGISVKESLSVVNTPRIKYGFLPFWNVSQVNPSELEGLTHVSYFSLTSDSAGNIVSHTTPSQLDPGWYSLTKPATQNILQTAKDQNIQLHLGISLFDETVITDLLSNSAAQDRLIRHVILLVELHQFQGINIDFEPTIPLASQSANFTAFIQKLNQKLKQRSQEYQLIIDIYPAAAKNRNLWQLPELNPHVDQFIVMTYDYHRINSTEAGPVAPLYSQNDQNIMYHLSLLTRQVPPQKLILGLANYGYQWQTTSTGLNAKTYPQTGKTIKFKDLKDHIEDWGLQPFWDSRSAATWYAVEIDNRTYQLHFDPPGSVALKEDLVIQSDLAGIAIWALGYDNQILNISLP